jgi:hypothetical protein
MRFETTKGVQTNSDIRGRLKVTNIVEEIREYQQKLKKK